MATTAPAAASDKKYELPSNAIVLPPTAQLQALLTLIRDENTHRWVYERKDDWVREWVVAERCVPGSLLSVLMSAVETLSCKCQGRAKGQEAREGKTLSKQLL